MLCTIPILLTTNVPELWMIPLKGRFFLQFLKEHGFLISDPDFNLKEKKILVMHIRPISSDFTIYMNKLQNDMILNLLLRFKKTLLICLSNIIKVMGKGFATLKLTIFYSCLILYYCSTIF